MKEDAKICKKLNSQEQNDGYPIEIGNLELSLDKTH